MARPVAGLALGTAALVALNLAVAFTGVALIVAREEDELLPQEVWFPVALLLLWQGATNGVLMMASRRTRSIGIGVLGGTVMAALGFGAWLWLWVFPAFE